MLGDGYPMDCFKDQHIVNELLCSICLDVARSIMSCNNCDRAFCESCITRFWMYNLETHPQCPCCKIRWREDDEETLFLQHLKKYIHRDRKCENILQCLEVCCPCSIMDLVPRQTLSTAQSYNEINDTAQQILSTAAKDQKEPHQANDITPTTTVESKCSWKGSLREYDEHMVSCHPSVAPNISKLNAMLKKLQSAKSHEYLKKAFMICDIMKHFGNQQDLHLLVQLSVSEALLKIAVEPFFEKDLYEDLKQRGNENFDDLTNPNINFGVEELATILQVYSSTIISSKDVGPRVLAEFFLLFIMTQAILPITVMIPVIAKEELAKFDQRFCGIFWVKLIDHNPIESTFELFDGVLRLVNPHIIRTSEKCFLSLISNIFLLERIAVECRKIRCMSRAHSPFFGHESSAFEFLAYGVRLISFWKPVVPSVDHPLVLTHLILDGIAGMMCKYSSEFPFFIFADHDLLQKVILPMMASIHGDRFYPVVLYGGGLCYILNSLKNFLLEVLHRQANHWKRRVAAKKKAWEKKKNEEKNQIKSSKYKRKNAALQSDEDENQEKPEDENEIDLDFTGFCYSKFPLNKMSYFQATLWTIARICETINFPTLEQYSENFNQFAFIMQKPSDLCRFSDIFTLGFGTFFEILMHSLLLSEFITVNNLIIRILFSCLAMWKLDRVEYCGGWKAYRHTLVTFLRKKYQGRLQIDHFELLLLQNMAFKLFVSSTMELQEKEVLSDEKYAALIKKKVNHLTDIDVSYMTKDFTFVEKNGYQGKVNKSFDSLMFLQKKYPNSSVMVDAERTVVYSMLENIDSIALELTEEEEALEADAFREFISNDPYLNANYNNVHAPEMAVTVGALSKDNGLPNRMLITDANTLKDIDEGLKNMRSFRTKREMQYFEKLVQGMDIFILEHLFHGRLSRFVLNSATRSSKTVLRRRVRKRSSSHGIESGDEDVFEVDFVCLTSTIHVETPEPPMEATSTMKGRNKAKGLKAKEFGTVGAAQEESAASSLTVGMNIDTRLQVMAQWIRFAQWMKSPSNQLERDDDTSERSNNEVAVGNSRLCSWYYDEAVVACYLLIFNVPAKALVITEERHRSETAGNMIPETEQAEIYPLHDVDIVLKGSYAARKHVWGSVDEINEQEKREPRGGLLSEEAVDAGVLFLNKLVKENNVDVEQLMEFISLLANNATTQISDDHRYRYLHHSSRILMQLVTEITNASKTAKENLAIDSLQNSELTDHHPPRKKARRKK